MTTIVKRLSVLTLAGLLLALTISGGRALAQDGSQATAPATQSANANLPAKQPVIQGTLNGAQAKSQGAAGSYCWPQADGSTPECDVVDNPQAAAPIAVNDGDGILFTLDPAAPGPATLKGVLLDDKNADGEPPEIDLTATGGIFTVESLNPGAHRLEITAVYPGDVDGNQPFVTYVFSLTVGAGSSNATTQATSVQAVLPTATTEAAASEAPTVAQPTATEVQPTVVAPTNTESVVQPTVVPPTATAIVPPTIEPTTVPPTVVPPTAEQPTAVQPTAEQPTAEQPTAVSPTVLPTVVQPTTAASGSSTGGTNVTVPQINVPPASLIVNARTFQPIAVNTCIKGDQGETVCINRPTNTTIQRVFAAPGDVAQITFGGPRPTSITVTQLSSDGSKTIGTQTIQGDNLVLYTLPAANGNFILDIQIVYPQGKVDYFFRLSIGS